MKLSTKYDMIYEPLIERIIAEESEKKDPIKSAKTRMHQLYGAYLHGNSHKKATVLLEEMNTAEILSLHASTRERLLCINELYHFIAEYTGAVKSILDLGCGFNPFAVSLMPDSLVKNLEVYHTYDIDLRTRDLLNCFFEMKGLPAAAKCADLAAETPGELVDLAFMLKLIPVLEAQCAGRGFKLANALNTRFLVISYPVKSLGGREKGMEKNYAASFKKAEDAGLLNNFTLVASERIGSELIYVLKDRNKNCTPMQY